MSETPHYKVKKVVITTTIVDEDGNEREENIVMGSVDHLDISMSRGFWRVGSADRTFPTPSGARKLTLTVTEPVSITEAQALKTVLAHYKERGWEFTGLASVELVPPR